MISSCSTDKNSNKKAIKWPDATAPVAAEKAHQRVIHGESVDDPYYWLNDYFKKGADSSAVVAYLEAENAYTDTMMKDTEALQSKLFTEMKNRIKEADESVPYLMNGYYYYLKLRKESNTINTVAKKVVWMRLKR